MQLKTTLHKFMPDSTQFHKKPLTTIFQTGLLFSPIALTTAVVGDQIAGNPDSLAKIGHGIGSVGKESVSLLGKGASGVKHGLDSIFMPLIVISGIAMVILLVKK